MAPLSESIDRRQLFWFFLIALVVLAAGMGLRDPWPADEPRFALAAKQMVESGNWLIPHRGSELYSDKPPMFMASEAFFYTLTHSWRIAFLLPSLLAGLGMLGLVYDLGRRLWNHRTGLIAATALLCAFQFVYQVKRAQIDPSVSFFITLANYGLLRHFLLGPDWRAYWLGCFAAGLGVITKGVGILALFLFLPYFFARWKNWNNLPQIRGGALRWLAGGLFLLLALSLWLVPMLYAAHVHDEPEYKAYVHDILFRQTAGRYTDSWDHHQPWWYYFGVIATGWLPLSLALPWLVPAWRERLAARDARSLLPLAWICLVVLFFMFPKGKRDVYIMPALPWLALVAAPHLEGISQNVWVRRIALGVLLFLGVAAFGGSVYAILAHPPFAARLVEQRGFGDNGAGLWWVMIGIGGCLLVAAAIGRMRRAVPALLAGLASMWLIWSFWAYPILNDSSSAAGVMRHAGELIGPDAELGMVAWKEQNLLHADRHATDFGFGRPWPQQLALGAAWLREAPQKRWLFILDEAMGACVDKAKGTYVGHANRREWWLIRADALRPDCDPATQKVDENDDPNAP